MFSALFIFGVIFGYFVLGRAFVEDVYKPLTSITGAGGYYADLSDFYFLIFRLFILQGMAFTTPVYVISLIRFDAGWVHARETTRLRASAELD